MHNTHVGLSKKRPGREAAGRLRVDDPIEKHLGGFPAEKRAATVEHLASHTSGLVVAGTALSGQSREAFIRDVKRAPPETLPGTQYRYSNAGFSILAALIEQVTSQTYERYVRENIFLPAGMRTAIFRDEVPSNDPLFARGYVGSRVGVQPGPPNPYVWGTRGAGGVWCTVGDMSRWIVALETGKIVSDTQRKKLFSSHTPPAQEAYGWHVGVTPEKRTSIMKGGGSDDFASQLLYYPNDHVTIVWASNNLQQRWRQTLNRVLPELVFGEKH
jgi:CubicO group peptidase (beta-lactamase class C family)